MPNPQKYPVSLKISKDKDTKLRLQTCLDWVEDVYDGFKLDPAYIGPKMKINTIDEIKSKILIKYIFRGILNKGNSGIAINASDLGVALIPTQFSAFEHLKLGTLRTKVIDTNTDKIPHNLKEELRKYFFED